MCEESKIDVNPKQYCTSYAEEMHPCMGVVNTHKYYSKDRRLRRQGSLRHPNSMTVVHHKFPIIHLFMYVLSDTYFVEDPGEEDAR